MASPPTPRPPWTLSALGDEIAADPAAQLDVLLAAGIRHLELRGAWDKSVLALTDGEVAALKTLLARRGVAVSAIASPVGKVPIAADFAPQVAALDRALRLAAALAAPFVRVFSYYIPDGDDPARHREEVLDRLGQLAHRAEAAGLTLLHENERHIYGDTPTRCHDLLAQVDSPALRALWDPANFVLSGVQPHTDGYALLRPYLAYVHVKDARRTGEVVPAGRGDGEVRQTLAALRASGFEGVFSLEPHLATAGPAGGFTGPALFRVAVDAFKNLLRGLDIAWA